MMIEISAASGSERQKDEANMNQKLTILYARLSKDDGEGAVSNSITNQLSMLQKYADSNGLSPTLTLQDDGFTDTNFSRPGEQELIERVECGEVSAILMKTLDWMGCDHLRIGLYLEQFHDMGIRLIAVSEGIDTSNGIDDFSPFRNLLNEMYAKKI